MKKGGQDKKEDRHRPREPNATKRSIGLSIAKASEMKIAISSDEYCELVDVLQLECQKRGHVVFYHGPRKGDTAADWPAVTAEAARQVQSGEADEAIVLCYTGTGASIAANKLRGIRAALCIDPETA
jgi:ribose 5-phosphate isomerase B